MAEDARPDPRPRVVTGPRLGRIHDRVIHVLAEVDAGAPADRALANAFRRARDLGSHDRAQVSEEVYGLLRHRRGVQDVLQRAVASQRKSLELLDAPIQSRMEVLAYLAREGTSLSELEARDRYAARRIPKVMERIVTGRLPATKRSPQEAHAIRSSLPTWLFRRLAEGLGEARAIEIGDALLMRAPVTLRVDPSRLSREAFRTRLQEAGHDATPTPLAPHGLVLQGRADLREWPELSDARVEVQDEGSQLVALACGARPGARVLDACAGAGGKTLALWSEMKAEGRLVAIEPDKKKLAALRRRTSAAEVPVQVAAIALEEAPEGMRDSFDCVLVDAPCTGSGTLRRHPDIKWRLEEGDLHKEAGRQARLLGAALALLKPGGRLVYATCSVLREENEEVIENLVKVAPELVPAPLIEGWGLDVDAAVGAHGAATARIGPGPDQNGPDGFFVAAFTKHPS